jgi:SAM-dependent methyltransferase
MRARAWRVKAVAQRGFSSVPGGHHLNYLFQRSLGGLPLSDDALEVEVDKGQAHLAALRALDIDPAESRFFEFGAGYDLHLPLIQSRLGFHDQTVVDIRRVARAALVVDIASRLPRTLHESDPTPADPQGTMDEVLAAHRITYAAPADARSTGRPSGSMDAVVTTSTLEHIPAADLAAILRECHRLLRDGGGMSMQIDYSDHWSHFDHRLTPYNFLRFPQREWDRWNPALQYQSRLRHSDYLALFDAAGFEIARCETAGDDEAGLEDLAAVPLAPPFDQYDEHDAAITFAHVVARKRPRP